MDDITAFEKSYKGSEEEVETLRSAYVDCEGDMERILEEVSECECVCVCVCVRVCVSCEPGRSRGHKYPLRNLCNYHFLHKYKQTLDRFLLMSESTKPFSLVDSEPFSRT